MVPEKIRAEILNGALTDKKHYMVGNYKGFYITVNLQQPYFLVNIHYNAPTEADAASLQSFLTQQQVAVKALGKAEIKAHEILLFVSVPNLQKNLPKVMNECVDPVINYLISANYTSGCGNCGDYANPLSVYDINGQHHYICDTCAKEIEASLISNQQEMKMKKGNIVPGIIGALLGALIGAVLWVLIYKLGYIAGIAGAITAICAFKGYEMFAKHLDKKGVIISLVISVLMIFLANRIAWAWEAYEALKDYGYTFTAAFQTLDEILAASDLTGSFYGDLATGYFLTALCSIGSIIRTFKNSSGSYRMKKMQ